MRPLNAAQRYKVTTSLFLLTFFGAVFTVAAPSVFPCPAFEHRQVGLAYADGWNWEGIKYPRNRRRQQLRRKELKEGEGWKEQMVKSGKV
jgi:Cytochrome C oxidase assembly factor 2